MQHSVESHDILAPLKKLGSLANATLLAQKQRLVNRKVEFQGTCLYHNILPYVARAVWGIYMENRLSALEVKKYLLFW